MRKYAIAVGVAAALAGVTAAPAAAQTITPGSYDWGQVDPKEVQPVAEFQLKAGGAPLNGIPTVISGDSSLFNVAEGFCDGSLNPDQSCIFRVRLNPGSQAGRQTGVVGVPGGPTATVSATLPGGSTKGKKKCKKGKKGAASAKKKKCGKKGKR